MVIFCKPDHIYIFNYIYHFRYFKEAAFDIHNCESVSIVNSYFHENKGTGIIKEPFRGNTGAVAITYSDIDYNYGNIKIKVINTSFINNSALTNNRTFRSTSDAFYNGILTGRAGGLGVFVNKRDHNVIISIDRCQFINNYARIYGGGLYFVYHGLNSQHIGIVTNTTFIGNSGGLGAGGFASSVLSKGLQEGPHIVQFKDCYFESNQGDAGGGMYFYVILQGGRGNLLELDNCTFVGNRGVLSENEFGAAIAASLYEKFQEKESFPIHNIHDW